MQQVTNPGSKKQCKTKNVFQIKSNIYNTSLIEPPVLSPTSKKIRIKIKIYLANKNLPFIRDITSAQPSTLDLEYNHTENEEEIPRQNVLIL